MLLLPIGLLAPTTALIVPATWDPTAPKSGSQTMTLTNGNKTAHYGTSTGAPAIVHLTSFQSTGKFYGEITGIVGQTSGAAEGYSPIGFLSATSCAAAQAGTAYTQYVLVYNASGNVMVNGVNKGTTAAWTSAGTICWAIDLTARLLWWRVGTSGQWNNNGTANPATGVGGYDISACTGALTLTGYGGNGGSIFVDATVNNGGTAFGGTVPTGFGNWPL